MEPVLIILVAIMWQLRQGLRTIVIFLYEIKIFCHVLAVKCDGFTSVSTSKECIMGLFCLPAYYQTGIILPTLPKIISLSGNN